MMKIILKIYILIALSLVSLKCKNEAVIYCMKDTHFYTFNPNSGLFKKLALNSYFHSTANTLLNGSNFYFGYKEISQINLINQKYLTMVNSKKYSMKEFENTFNTVKNLFEIYGNDSFILLIRSIGQNNNPDTIKGFTFKNIDKIDFNPELVLIGKRIIVNKLKHSLPIMLSNVGQTDQTWFYEYNLLIKPKDSVVIVLDSFSCRNSHDEKFNNTGAIIRYNSELKYCRLKKVGNFYQINIVSIENKEKTIVIQTPYRSIEEFNMQINNNKNNSIYLLLDRNSCMELYSKKVIHIREPYFFF